MLNWPREWRDLRKNLRLPRKSLEDLQLNLLREQISNAYQHVKFYREAFTRNGLDPRRFRSIDDLQAYPVITREEIQRDTTSFLSDQFPNASLKKSHSSGTTGRPLWSFFDHGTWVRKKYLSKARVRRECGLELGERLAIFDAGSPAELAGRNRNARFFKPLMSVRYFSIFEDPHQNLVDLVQWRPSHIESPPSNLFHLARVWPRAKAALTVRRIHTSSEYLEPTVRKFVEKRFAARIFDIYGCTELKEVAWECERKEGYHINEDEVLVEILNGSDPVKAGEVGDIVITDLRNRAMPLIRYRIGDRGRLLANLCSCCRTFSLMAPAAGRSSEYITVADGSRLSPYRLTTAIEHTRGLLQYQFVQENTRSLTVKVIMPNEEGEGELHRIAEKILGIVGPGMEIRMVRCDRLDIEENGKFKVVKSKVSP